MKRSFCLVFLLCVMALTFSGCMTFKDFHEPEMDRFQSTIKSSYPAIADLKVEKSSSGTIFVSFIMKELSEPEVLSIIREFRRVCMMESVQQSVIEGEPIGHAAEFCVDFRKGNVFLGIEFKSKEAGKYEFAANYYHQHYNSGMDPSEYTVDGYTTWEGAFYSDWEDTVPAKSFSAAEIAGEDS